MELITVRRAGGGRPVAPLKQVAAVAGVYLGCDVLLDDLAPFAVPAAEVDGDWPPAAADTRPEPDAPVTFQGRGFVGGAERDVHVWSGTHGSILTLSGLGRFSVAPDGRWITYAGEAGDAAYDVGGSDAAASREMAHALLGPPLMLALMARGRWCLHAAGLADGSGLVAVLGPSGVGKSTLAAAIDGRAGWTRVADDILPITVPTPQGRAQCWPRFPQYKLAPEAQVDLPPARSIPLRALVFIVPRPAETVPALMLERLGAAAAARAVLRNTVAGRLLDGPAAGRQLRMAAALAETIPAWRLDVARRQDGLAEAAELFRTKLAPRFEVNRS